MSWTGTETKMDKNRAWTGDKLGQRLGVLLRLNWSGTGIWTMTGIGNGIGSRMDWDWDGGRHWIGIGTRLDRA